MRRLTWLSRLKVSDITSIHIACYTADFTVMLVVRVIPFARHTIIRIVRDGFDVANQATHPVSDYFLIECVQSVEKAIITYEATPLSRTVRDWKRDKAGWPIVQLGVWIEEHGVMVGAKISNGLGGLSRDDQQKQKQKDRRELFDKRKTFIRAGAEKSYKLTIAYSQVSQAIYSSFRSR